MMQFSVEEENLREKIREIYNSGNGAKAVELSQEFLKKYPESLLAKYSFCVMNGDYATDIKHSPEEKIRLLAIAKKGTQELLDHPMLALYPYQFQRSVKNEYYWFHEMPEDQYKLGIGDMNGNPRGGHYSACVGSSQLAVKKIKEGLLVEGEGWAKKAIEHYLAFEKIAPDWYNINYFAAQAEACLGNKPAALKIYKEMYKKQKTYIKDNEVEAFEKHIDLILGYRTKK